MARKFRFERALIVLGEGGAGKSFQIRHMYRDVRMGNDENPLPRNVRRVKVVKLSHDRRLYVRIQSPQEAMNETVQGFYRKIDEAIRIHGPDKRWSMVCAMRIKPHRLKVSGLKLTQKFINRYSPERVRVALLHPRYDSEFLEDQDLTAYIDEIRALTGHGLIVEPMIVDARHENGMLLPDFFDFT